MSALIRVELPAHLRTLAEVRGEVQVQVERATLAAVLDALELAHPALRGTIRGYGTGRRRAFLRFFAAEEDISHNAMDAPLPPSVVEGREPLLVIGAIAGG